ncbi:hypothetical protein E1B28_009386 [Marasmius oreades]|uniref:Uncharacterized protein n=1 Tax=Marasmius oreades TaxID=181124 RepID=A0A9P7S101_9AGAR|nr:uncharacterized protein E1B28_009386 [Marasmius oreades]KAG7093100.1 hypothetical protein E1B28_009386 [Marasmius oreades]
MFFPVQKRSSSSSLIHKIRSSLSAVSNSSRENQDRASFGHETCTIRRRHTKTPSLHIPKHSTINIKDRLSKFGSEAYDEEMKLLNNITWLSELVLCKDGNMIDAGGNKGRMVNKNMRGMQELRLGTQSITTYVSWRIEGRDQRVLSDGEPHPAWGL